MGLTKSDVAPNALGFLSHKNKFRMLCLFVSGSPWLDMLVLGAIFSNFILQAGADDLQPTHSWTIALEQSELFFVIFFTIECACKLCAYGCIMHRKCYLRRDSFNVADFTFVVLG